ncbi:MAG: zinc ABC transporter substrate-binding protein [Eubacteriaceae bacterium]|nr:zinc ABC transporter substrate-binding protein [Eubacteriaceae bacterium]
MKIKSLIVLTLCMAMLCLAGCSMKAPEKVSTDDSPLKVIASFYPMADFADKIGGDNIAVQCLVSLGMEAHDWEPTTADIALLEEADLFIINGAGMEPWATDLLQTLSNKNLVVVNTSEGLDLLENDESHDGHDHGDQDPHVWLNPLYAKQQMSMIMEALKELDATNSKTYQDNYEKWANKCEELDQNYRETLSPLNHKDILVSHQAFGYLCNAYGLNQIAIEGLSPEGEPNPARMAEIIDFMNKHQTKVIFYEENTSSKVAEAIARDTGAKTMVLNPLESLSQEQLDAGEDYFSIMTANLKGLQEALSD